MQILDVWGFSRVLAVTVSTDTRDLPNLFAQAFSREAKARGIDSSKPSDALDMSRDLILDDAARSIGFTWHQKGEELALVPVGVSVALDDVFSS